MLRVVKNFAKSLEVLRNYNDDILLVIKCWLLDSTTERATADDTGEPVLAISVQL